MTPTNREEFIQYVLTMLGHPVIEINVSEEQIDNRITAALKYYADYHFDGSEKIYYKHLITEEDKQNKFIILPENIIGAVSIFSIGDPMVRSDDLFNIRYQIALNDLYTLTSVSMVPYYMVMEHLSLISEMLVGKKPIRYSRHKNKLYVDMDWNSVRAGEYLLVEAYEVIDPEIYADVWGDRWLQNYAAVLIEETWGRNLSKFSGMSLPGGVQFNGDAILERALATRQKMEDEMISSYSMPPMDLYG